MAANGARDRDSSDAARKVDEPTRVEPEFVSKCREDLFREASELSRLTGAQVGIITYSPSGQPHVFGTTPDPDTIFQRFMEQYGGGSSSGDEDSGSDTELSDECLEETVEELDIYIENLNRLRAMVAQRMTELENQQHRDANGGGSASQPEMAQQKTTGQGNQQPGPTGDVK